MKNVAVILAGGVGQRMGSDIPKQFCKVSGKSVIEHTISVFEEHPLIDEISIVVHANSLNRVEELCLSNHYSKVKKILVGGKERYHSSLAAINAYKNKQEEVNLIFHDSVRPLVTSRIITECINKLNLYSAVDVAIPATDTIIEVNSEKSEIVDIPNRNYLYNGQTPQAFKLSIIDEAYKRALADSRFVTTDDCGVVLKYMPEIPIAVVNGEGFNMKLTHKEDLFLIDKLFQLKSIHDISAYNSSRELKNKVIIVFGGGYGIGHSILTKCLSLGGIAYSFSRTETSTDVSDLNSVKKALELVFSKEGRIDCIINTAGLLMKEPLASMNYSDMRRLIDVNYWGNIIIAKEAYPYLEKTSGHLLLFTSSSYTRGRSLYSLYSSCKSAVVNLVQALAEEWSRVKVNCINPERTKTPMRTRNFGNESESTLLNPDDVANAAICTILSDVTGQVIDVRRKMK